MRARNAKTRRANRLAAVLLGCLLVALPSVALAGIGTWSSFSISPGEEVYEFKASPDLVNDSKMLIGVWGGTVGIYRSDDSGDTWAASNTGLTNKLLRSIAYSPEFTTDDTVYAATNWGGVFRSLDEGNNWTAVPNGISNLIYSLGLSPSFGSDNTIFAGTASGVFRSTDRGTSWVQKNAGLTDLHIQSLAVGSNATNDTIVFAGTRSKGVGRSTDDASSWNMAITGMANQDVRAVAVSPAFATDDTVYAATQGKIYDSVDGGRSWQQAGGATFGSNFAEDISISPNYETDCRLVAASAGASTYYSWNEGFTWEHPYAGLTPSNTYIKSVQMSPDFANDKTMYAAGNGYPNSPGGGDAFKFEVTTDGVPVSQAVTRPRDPNQLGWFRTTANIKICLEEGEGTAYYQWDSTNDATYSTYTGPVEAIEGEHTLYYFSVNGAGDQTEDVSSQPSPRSPFMLGLIQRLGLGSNVHEQTFNTDLTPPVDPTGSSSTHVVGVPSNDTTIEVSWSGATDSLSGVDGYSIGWSATPGFTPDTTKDIEKNVLTASNGSLPDGTYYFNLSTGDEAENWTSTMHLGPFIIDTAPPSTIASAVTPDGQDGWHTTQPGITISSDESGISQYRWATGDAWTTYSSTVDASDGQVELQYRSIDIAGNTEDPNYIALKVDTTDPTDPNVLSDTHATGDASNDNTLGISWDAGADGTSGVDGFSYMFSNLAIDTPDTTKDVEEGSGSIVSTPLADGAWYFHLRTFDNAGNKTETVHFGPFTVDTVSPFVDSPSPQNGATEVAQSFQVLIDFDAPVSPDTITTPGVITIQDADLNNVSLSVVSEQGGQRARIVASGYGLNEGKTYTGSVNVDVKDPAGNSLQTPFVWSFSTVPAVLPGPPVLSAFPSGPSGIDLIWTPSEDDVSVIAYHVFSATSDTEISSVTSRDLSLDSLAPGGTYDYYVKSRDNAANFSDPSNRVSLTLGAGGSTQPNSGNPVTVVPDTDVSLSFDDITSAGTTTVNRTSSAPIGPPSGFQFGDEFFEISTSAGFNGPINVSIRYDENAITGPESALKLFHHENDVWADITTYVDTENNIIHGQTSSFSHFGVGFPFVGHDTGNSTTLLVLGVIALILGLGSIQRRRSRI